MAVTNYIRLGSELVGERPLGGSRTNYARDALGSVGATLSGSSVQNRYAYKPFGSVLAKSGVADDPLFGWTGTKGYLSTSRNFAEIYVRARSYATSSGRWTSRDPFWPDERAYGYVAGRPQTQIDPSGATWQTGPVPQGFACGRGQMRKRVQNPDPSFELPAYWNLSFPLSFVLQPFIFNWLIPTESSGVTGCDVTSGDMWTLACETDCFADVTKSPIAVHEQKHRSDMGGCCANFGAAFRKISSVKGYQAAKDLLRTQWVYLYSSAWGGDAGSWFECRGYNESRRVADEYFSSYCQFGSLDVCCQKMWWIRYQSEMSIVTNELQTMDKHINWRDDSAGPTCPYDAQGNSLISFMYRRSRTGGTM